MPLRKKRFLYIATFFILGLLSVVICSCGKDTPTESEPDATASASAIVMSDPEISAQTERLYKEYSENILLDASVTAPAGLTDSLFASAVNFDAETVRLMLIQGKDPTHGEPVESDNDIRYYVFEGSDIAEHLTIGEHGGCIIYRNKGFMRNVKFPTENFVTQTDHAFVNDGNPPYSLVYREKELVFMSAEQAVSAVRSALGSLGIETMDEVAVFAIDCKTMQSHQDVLIRAESDTVSFYDVKNPLTEEDEFYILSFTAACNGFPVSGFDSDLSARYTPGSVITVYYSQQGIVYLSIYGLYAPQGVAERHDTLLTAEETASKALDLYGRRIDDLVEDGHDIDEWLSGGRYVISKAELVYAPSACEDEYFEFMLVPAWQFTVRCRTLADRYYARTYEVCDIVTFNAVTGEII